jgi:hypothetical protein
MFTARTSHSGKLKALFEVLFSNTQDVVLTISKNGILSELSTVNNAIIYVDLPSTGFDEYIYTYNEPMYIGLGSHVNSFFKSLKNKTTVTLKINQLYTLDVTLHCDDCLITYAASFICAQNIYPIPIGEYDVEKSYQITTNTFNAMCKSFSKAAPEINVTKTQGQLSFTFALVGIASKSITFGSLDISDQETFFQQFKSDTFIRINKLTSFSTKTIRLCVEDNCLVIIAESLLGTIKVLLNADSNCF